MCGIAGIVGSSSTTLSKKVKHMTEVLNHRGPDAHGYFTEDGVSLGHRRLSIVDLTDAGAQPMISDSGNEIIVFNGEIYGFEELKKALKNYPYKGSSDTEVILALYQKHNDKMLAHLPGMFSFALWDKSAKRLFCARDRFGEKPFYYAIGPDNELIFGSELKAILASGLITPEIDWRSIATFLKHLFIPPNRTVYKNIFVLPPAHQMIYHNGNINISRYWSLPEINHKLTLSDTIESFQEKLHKAVSLQLISDVPIGAFLSGGLDSSTVVGIASKYKSNLNTFSFGFGKAINELPYAASIAKKFDTNHTELSAQNVRIDELLIEMTKVYDEPFADSSNIPTYLISKLAKEHVTVALTGDGADELCGGYGSYFVENDLNLGSYPRSLGKILKIGEKIANKLGNNSWRTLLHKCHAESAYDHIKDYHENEVNVYFTESELAALGLPEPYQYQNSFDMSDDINGIMRLDVENYMPGDILTKIDRAAMSNSLELRAPFLDVDLATFCLQMPHNLKVEGRKGKIILREAFGHLWTDEIKNRPKQGFGAPVNDWIKEEPVQNLLKDMTIDSSNTLLRNMPNLSKIEHYKKKKNYQSWILLVLDLWLKYHQENLTRLSAQN